MRLFILILFLMTTSDAFSQSRLRDHGIEIGVIPTGTHNAITDVDGVRVGHVTLIEGDHIRTGVTAILPHTSNLFQEKTPTAIYVANGFGKLAGSTQVDELGNSETPIILTNTLSVPTAADALIDYTLAQSENSNVRSVNPLVGETNDGRLNDIRGRHVSKEQVLQAIESASTGPVTEGNVGAGTGTVCFGFKGGIGTASRKLPEQLGGYTVGVLVQSNFGGVLRVNGVPVGQELEKYAFRSALEKGDGSCMIVVATNAPLDVRNLKRMAKRAMLGLGNTGGISSNGSGDYVIAFSTTPENRVLYDMVQPVGNAAVLHNDATSPLFMAAIEATEEAILNSMFAAETMTGNGHTIEKLPIAKVVSLVKGE